MAWNNADSFIKSAKLSTAPRAEIPKTMPQALTTIINFGKWDGCSIAHVTKVDPGYILWLLKSPNPSNPIYVAATFAKCRAEKTMRDLDSIGSTGDSSTMDELWPAAAEQMLQEVLENDVGFQQDCNMERAERVSYAQGDAYADALSVEHETWGNRD